MTVKRFWMLVFALLFGAFIAINLLTQSERLIGFADARTSQFSQFRFEADDAVWSFRSPLQVVYTDARLLHETHPTQQFSLDSLRVWLALTPKPSLARIAFTSGHLPARTVIEYLGAPFELTSKLEVEGDFSFGGIAKGALRVSGGEGTLDTRKIKRINRGPLRWARDSGHFIDWPELMAFDRLHAELDASRGFDDSRFTLILENLKLTGSGSVDFLARDIDYDFELLLTSEGDQGGFRLGKLVADVPWPIRCRGSFDKRLPCRLDFDALRDLALRLIARDVEDALSRTFGEVEQAL